MSSSEPDDDMIETSGIKYVIYFEYYLSYILYFKINTSLVQKFMCNYFTRMFITGHNVTFLKM